MPIYSIKYEWSIQQEFNLNFNFRVVSASSATNANNYVVNEQINSIYKPTILYPNGGEIIRAREIEITWLEQSPLSSDNLPINFEIFYCENFEQTNEPDYKMIATVPSGIGKYNWRIGNSIKSDNIRVAIRGINTRGQRSKFSVSAASFTIEKSAPIPPLILSPLPNSRHDSYVKFVFDDSAVNGTFSERSKYYIFFSSEQANIPTSIIAQNIPTKSGPIIWDTSNIPSASDYKITIFLQDDDGNRSKEVVVDNLQIVHDKYFYIDTEPPQAFIQINKGDEYIKETEAFVKVFAYDKITAVHSMQLIEVADQNIVGSPLRYARDVSWNFTDNDGVKTLRMQCQDFGGNRIEENSQREKFRILHDARNSSVVDIVANNQFNEVYVAINNGVGEVYKITSNTLVLIEDKKETVKKTLNKSVLTKLSLTVSSLAYHDDSLFIAVQTNELKGICYRWTGSSLDNAFAINDDNSIINTMTEYKNMLFFGLANGYLQQYSQNAITKIYEFSSAIDKIYTDRNVLYIIVKYSKNLYSFDGFVVREIIL